MQAAAAKTHRFTGRHMLIVMVSFMGTVFAVNFLMAYLANSTWSGLVVANGYDASQSFNLDERRARAQQAEGWLAKLTHQAGSVTLTFAGRDGKPLQGLAIKARAGRPTTASQDRVLDFHEAAAGTYVAQAHLAGGIWNVDIEVNGDGQTNYLKTYSLIVK